jgi:Ca2+-binding RTX toxin-like protein
MGSTVTTDSRRAPGAWLSLAVLAGLVTAMTAAVPATAGFTCDGRPATHVLTNGNDSVSYGLGNQVVVGRDGRDSISTGPGRDRVCAGFGNDLVDGEQGADPLLAGQQNRDQVIGKGGADKLTGGTEDDCGLDPRCPPAAFQGMSVIYPGLSGGRGNDLLDGGDGRDDLFGGPDDDNLFGGFGVDFLNGGTGNDNCDDGPGNDLPSVDC